jgi:NDP-sugar pyrophosphorylase family protein
MQPRMLDIVIPMAGYGSRFTKAGFHLPKPLIDVNGQPMIRRVIENLKPALPHRFIFLALEEHLQKYNLSRLLPEWAGSQTVCVPVRQVTEGAACTVLLAREFLRPDHDMMIANSDQLVDVSCTEYITWSRQENVDGSILVFEDNDLKWSYARVNPAGEIVEVAEKKAISSLATVGIYYFRSGQHFVKAADQMISKNIRVNNEFYVCPVYNEMIQKKQRLMPWKIAKSAMHGIGTPEDLAIYLRRAS